MSKQVRTPSPGRLGVLLGLLLLLCPGSATGQAPRWSWVFSPGRSADVWATAVDRRGNVYVTGEIIDSVVTIGRYRLAIQPAEYPYGDLFVAKFSPAGRCLWVAQAGGNREGSLRGNRDETGQALAIDAAGQVYVTGTFRSASVTFGATRLSNAHAPLPDFFVAKLSATGQWQWAVRGGGPRYDLTHAISLDATGQAVYVAGQFQQQAAFGPDTITTQHGCQGFVARLSAAGQWQWTVVVDTATSVCHSLAPAPDGSLYVAGEFDLPALPGADSASGLLAVAKLSPSGHWQWIARTQYAFADERVGLAVDGAGNAYVSGCLLHSDAAFGTHRIRRLGTRDAVVAKLSAWGEWQWVVGVALNTGKDQDIVNVGINALAVDAHGDVYVGGEFRKAIACGATTLRANGEYDAFLAKLSAAGEWQWATGLGGPGPDAVTGLAVGRRGRVYVAGHFEKEARLGRHFVRTTQPRPTPYDASFFLGCCTAP